MISAFERDNIIGQGFPTGGPSGSVIKKLMVFFYEIFTMKFLTDASLIKHCVEKRHAVVETSCADSLKIIFKERRPDQFWVFFFLLYVRESVDASRSLLFPILLRTDGFHILFDEEQAQESV